MHNRACLSYHSIPTYVKVDRTQYNLGNMAKSCQISSWCACHYIHSPHEIISTAGKTGHNSRRKRNQSWNLLIHISNKSASIKTKDIPIESSKLLCLNLILFYSKSCNLKTFPAVISRVFIFVINRPSQKSLDVKLSQLWSMLPVSFAFWYKMKAKRYYFLWQKKKADEESKSQEPCRLTQGKTHRRRKTRIFKVIP